MAEQSRTTRVQVDDARILPGNFRNFSGEETRFNKAGDRNFMIELTFEQAQQLAAIGLPVKEREARDEGGDPQYQLKVHVGYKVKQPQVNFISAGHRTLLGQDTIDILDSTDIELADLVINAVQWEMPATGTSGVKAWLSKAYITAVTDDLDARYAGIPLGGQTD